MSGPRIQVVGLVVLAAVTTGQFRSLLPIAAAENSKAAAKTWLEERVREFEEYQFEREYKGMPKLELESRSLLNWSNAERGTNQGALFLWTHEGRPQLIACAFEWGGSLKHEFHSLCTDPILLKRGDTTHRFDAGIEWAKLDGAPKPAATRALRLAQMRRQAERFRVTIGHKEWAETRLLPHPVFRSPESASGDVAVFVFVQGTDPECTLLLDATSEGMWRYGLARQTKWGLKAELDGHLAWERTPNHRPDATRNTPFLVLPQKPRTAQGRP